MESHLGEWRRQEDRRPGIPPHALVQAAVEHQLRLRSRRYRHILWVVEDEVDARLASPIPTTSGSEARTPLGTSPSHPINLDENPASPALLGATQFRPIDLTSSPINTPPVNRPIALHASPISASPVPMDLTSTPRAEVVIRLSPPPLYDSSSSSDSSELPTYRELAGIQPVSRTQSPTPVNRTRSPTPDWDGPGWVRPHAPTPMHVETSPTASPGGTSPTFADGEGCSVCLSRPHQVILGCGHNFCGRCPAQVVTTAREQGLPPKCPLCREPIQLQITLVGVEAEEVTPLNPPQITSHPSPTIPQQPPPNPFRRLAPTPSPSLPHSDRFIVRGANWLAVCALCARTVENTRAARIRHVSQCTVPAQRPQFVTGPDGTVICMQCHQRVGNTPMARYAHVFICTGRRWRSSDGRHFATHGTSDATVTCLGCLTMVLNNRAARREHDSRCPFVDQD